MPRENVDYSKTVIYKIQSIENEDDLYVGHTTDFTKRKNCHKRRCINENYKGYYSKVYKMIRDSGGWDCFTMIELYKFSCNDGNEARAEEDKTMRELKANMNSCRAFLSKEEKKESDNNYNKKVRDNRSDEDKQKKIEYDKNYRKNNKQKIDIYKKEIIICLCGSKCSKSHIKRHERTKKHQDYINSLEKAL